MGERRREGGEGQMKVEAVMNDVEDTMLNRTGKNGEINTRWNEYIDQEIDSFVTLLGSSCNDDVGEQTDVRCIR